MSKTVFLHVSSAFMFGGAIVKAGEVVEVSETEAKDLLHRGKAVLAEVEPADQLEDAVEVEEGEEVHEAVEQPAAEAPAHAKGKGGKKGK